MGKLKRIAEVFLTFAKIGAFTFGGGYAMVPLIEEEVVKKKKWVKEEEIIDVIAVAESTPGPIAINSATFVGYKTAGFWGSVCATLGVVLPSFVVIFLISGILRKFRDVKPVRYAFAGIRAGVLALICRALATMYRQSPKGAISYVIMGVSFLLAAFVKKINAIFIIIGSAVVGLITALVAARKTGKGKKNDIS